MRARPFVIAAILFASLAAHAGPVGTMRLVWTDATRIDPVTTAPRRLVVQLWYPAGRQPAARPAPYVMELDALRADLKTRLKFDDPGVLADVPTNASLDAPISGRKLPVVLFSHGFGTPRSMYTLFVRGLAEERYFVAAIDHPGMGVVAIDGRLVTPYAQPLAPASLSADQRFVLDTLASDPRFTAHVDLERVVMIGHSRGFVSATCAEDKRIKACVNLNGIPAPAERETGLAIPLLTVRATRGDNVQAQTAIYAAMRAPAFDVVVEGSHHSSVTDRDLFASHVRDVAERRQHAINSVVVAFLDQTLRGEKNKLPRVAKGFAEVTLSVRGR